MAYENLNITLVKGNLSVLYEKPIGHTIILMTDENAYDRPVLFNGPVLGGNHFLEVRQNQGRLEIISSVIHQEDLGVATAESVGLVPFLTKDKKASREEAGLFDHTCGREKSVYHPGSREYQFLFSKLNTAGLVKWAQENPYREPTPVHASGSGGDQEAE